MRPGDPIPTEPERIPSGPLIAAAVVAGWVAHDLLLFLHSGEPRLALEGLPRSLLVVFGAALLGGLVSLAPEFLALAVAASVGCAALLPRLGLGLGLTRSDELAAVAQLHLTLAFGAALWLARRLQLGRLRAGLALGALAAVAFWWRRRGLEAPSHQLAAVAFALLVLGLVRPTLPRLLASGLALAGLVWANLASLDGLPRVWVAAAPPPAAVAAASASERPDVVLVVLEGVRATRLAPYGHDRATTPHLDRFAERHAVRFDQARSTSSWTLPSHASLFTGLAPARHGATHPRGDTPGGGTGGGALPARPLRGDVPTLAELLGAAGYRTGAVFANGSLLHPRFGLARGFEHYDARPGGHIERFLPLAQMAGAPQRAGHLVHRDAKAITDLALDWLARDDGRPSFLAVNYMDVHTPRLPPPPFDRAFGGPVREPLAVPYPVQRDQYDRALLYLDSELARLLEWLERREALVVLTSSHGEALGEHGFWSHGWTLFDPVVRVPLYVRPAKPRETAAVAAPLDGADVFHLILDSVGLEAPLAPDPRAPSGEWYRPARAPSSPALDGKPLDRDLLAWVEGSLKLIVDSDGGVLAFDLANDPRETEPLELDDAARAELRARARVWWDTNPAPAAPVTAPLGPDELRRLEALGEL